MVHNDRLMWTSETPDPPLLWAVEKRILLLEKGANVWTPRIALDERRSRGSQCMGTGQ